MKSTLRLAVAIHLVLLCLFIAPRAVHATGTPANTAISNTAHADWQDAGGGSFSVASNTVTVTVQAVYTAAFTVPSGAQTCVTGTTIYYAVTLSNTGNDPNGYNLTAATDKGWTTKIYHDTGTVGTYESGTDAEVATTGADSMAQDTSYTILVGVTVPAGTLIGTVGTTTITATGNSHATAPASTTAALTTTALTPVLAVTKAVKNLTTPDGSYLASTNAKPNDVLEYQIKVENTGNATANKVVLTDTLNANLSFDTATYPGFYIGPDGTAYNGTGNAGSGPGAGDDSGACTGDTCGRGNISGTAITVNLGNGAVDGTGPTSGGSLAAHSAVYVYFRGKVK